MYYLIEIFFALIITYLFVKYEKPKLRFLFYGYFFFIFTLFLRIPFKFLEVLFKNYFSSALPLFIVILSSIFVTEITKYLSLKKFLKTKSFKNGILFGIGWTTLESISIFSIYFFKFFFDLFGVEFNIVSFFGSLTILEFVFFFVFNLAVTVLIVISIINKNIFYLIYSILISFVVYFTLRSLNGVNLLVFGLFVFVYSFYIIFRYRNIK